MLLASITGTCESTLIPTDETGADTLRRRILNQRKKESDGKEVDMSDILDGMQKKARDHARVPMQV